MKSTDFERRKLTFQSKETLPTDDKFLDDFADKMMSKDSVGSSSSSTRKYLRSSAGTSQVSRLEECPPKEEKKEEEEEGPRKWLAAMARGEPQYSKKNYSRYYKPQADTKKDEDCKTQ